MINSTTTRTAYGAVNGNFDIIPGNGQDIGKRDEQQDSFGFSNMENEALVRDKGVMCVVADGMGGLSNGNDASLLAVETIIKGYESSLPSARIPKTLKELFISANNAVYQFASSKEMEEQIGTTAIAVVIHNDRLYWASVGDSHIYLFRNNALTKLNYDHIYANQLMKYVNQGVLTQEDANNHPEKGALTSYIGTKDMNELDQNTVPFPLVSGDKIVLCSDGLDGTITTQEMESALGFPPQQACSTMIDMVLQKDKRFQDNVSVAVLSCEEY